MGLAELQVEGSKFNRLGVLFPHASTTSRVTLYYCSIYIAVQLKLLQADMAVGDQ